MGDCSARERRSLPAKPHGKPNQKKQIEHQKLATDAPSIYTRALRTHETAERVRSSASPKALRASPSFAGRNP